MRNYVLTILLFGITGCIDLDFSTEWDIELWEQKIENSNLSIYSFDAWGGRDSNISGLKIKESSKGFTQDDVTKEDEFSFVKSIPNKDNLDVIKVLWSEGNHSNKLKQFYQIKGININQEVYEIIGRATKDCMTRNYNFKSFEETRDSLIFYDNESKFMNGKDYERISIPKGNVYLRTSGTTDNQKLLKVVYSTVVIYKDDKENEKICITRGEFEPINEIDISAFSDYGIYKPIK